MTLNSTVLEGAGGRFSASFPVGTTVDITVECLNSSRAVIIRTATKTITITSGINTVNINLSQDGTEIAAPPTPATGRVKYYGGEGAQNIPNDTNTYETGEDVTLMTLQQEPTRSGYIFNGWTANVELTGWKGWDNRIEVSLPLGQAFSAVYNQSPGSPEYVNGFVMPDVGVVLTAQWRDAAASVTIDGVETNFEDFTNAWDYANGQTATLKLYQDASSVSVTLTSGNVTLDLNGKTLEGDDSAAGQNTVITIGANSSQEMPTLTLKGNGRITKGNANNGGGGVYIYPNGKFIMQGGSLYFNTASAPRYLAVNGGGVYNAGTFVMEGGEITMCRAYDGGNGGGIYVAANAKFTKTGGTVSGNSTSVSLSTNTAGKGKQLFVAQNGTYNINGTDITVSAAEGFALDDAF